MTTIPFSIPEPGEGFRLLKIGEIIRSTDEVYDGAVWFLCECEEGKIFDGVRNYLPRRRKLDT